MASTSKEKVSSVPKEDGSIAEMKTQHNDAMQDDPESYKADKDPIDFILQKLRHTKCSLLLERTFDSNTLLHVAASLGHDQIVEAILSIQQCQELLTAKNSSGDLPLHVAANAGHLPIVVKLLNRPLQHFKAQNSDAATAEHSAMVDFVVMSHQCYELLIAKNSNGDLPLHVAANAGHFSIVRHLVMLSDEYHREFLRVQKSNGDHLHHLAANAGLSSLVQHFIMLPHQCQEHLMVQNSNGDLPLHVAANAGHLSIVQHLVKFSYRCQEFLTPKNSGDNTPLPYPPVDANAGYQPSVDLSDQKLQDRYTSKLLRVKNKEGNTPLHLALIKKYEEEDLNLKTEYHEVAKFLIEKDPDACTDLNEANKDPLDLAIKAQDKELQQLMSNHLGFSKAPAWGDAEMDSIIPELDSIIPIPVLDSIIPELERVPHKKKDKVESMDPKLYEAVQRKDIDFIKAQDPEHSALSDKTPELNSILHLAAASSDDDHQFVKAILEIQLLQKSVTEKNSNDDLPLHVAARAGNIKIVKLLVEWSNGQLQDHSTCGSQWEKNMEGNTPLHLALINKFQVGRSLALKARYNEVARFLVKNGPEGCFYYPNKERESPLYLAAEAGDEELVKLMIDTVPLLPYGKSNVQAAIYYLMTITNLPYGKSIVHAAIDSSNTARKKDILSTVLTKLPHLIKEQVDTEMTPLSYASSIGYFDGVQYLFGKSPDCAYKSDEDGFFPIHIASKKGNVQVIEFFLKKNLDMSELLDREGRNILHVAAMWGKAKMVAYMLKRNGLERLINGKDKKGNTPLHLASKKKHPLVVYILTWDKRVNLRSLNILNMTAFDMALDYKDIFAYRELLTSLALIYAGARRAPPSVRRKNPQSLKLKKSDLLDEYKDFSSTLVVVATLVITVTFAAAFTMPGGYNGSGGAATFLEKHMFHLFTICNSIAMFSAVTVVVALIWAQQRDLGLFLSASQFSVPRLGLTLTMVSIAFMASNYLVLRNLHWLAYLVLIIGSFFILALSILFIPLFLPRSPQNLIARYIIYFPFYLLVKASRSDA
ncbi:hypothetical protein SO802_004804 [Lithocarpus litseifolius]|uniref:PGG domain-containing protein n=1 Tax=Lithocarpus litseifolius TaxID=425828 RepID=A0AAW2DLX4_9ROSI